MMSKDRLLFLISDENWTFLVHEFNVDDICHLISYKDSMALAYDLFFKNLYSDEFQDFSVRLFFAIRKAYDAEWNTDWKNDAFLGKLCSITWRYDEMYEFYKKAYDKLTDPPDSLLLLLASCNSAPGVPPINDQESEEYLQKAITKKITYEAALMMKGLARDKEDKEQEGYWDHICLELEKNNVHTEIVIPDVLLAQNRR
jgi:hypothetical protein